MQEGGTQGKEVGIRVHRATSGEVGGMMMMGRGVCMGRHCRQGWRDGWWGDEEWWWRVE